jgi:hypothetical protein
MTRVCTDSVGEFYNALVAADKNVPEVMSFADVSLRKAPV